jgi:ABC-type phosphate transport system substrate-binding protein
VRIVSKLLLAATTAAAMTAMMAGPALADPPSGVTPKPSDVVGVGSDTTEFLFDQVSADYNASHSTGKLYSWDALNPAGGPQGDPIVTKSGCTSIPRPFGSGAGVLALENTTKTGTHPCIDYARSSSPRSSTDPNSITYITLAGDAVTYATQPGSNAPSNLDTADLAAIYSCHATTWNALPDHPGTSTATIAAMLPQSASGTRKFFLGAIGLGTAGPGPCVSTSNMVQGAAGNGANNLEENEGIDPSLNTNKANVIFPFSVGKWIAERWHSASCGTVAQCFANPTNCHPTATQNVFGCNTHGTMTLRPLNGTAPTVGTGGSTTINPSFTSTFTRPLSAVVNNPTGVTTPTIPTYLKKYFGPTGFFCTSSKAKSHIKKYGFLVLPNGTGAGHCGFAN